MSEHPIEGLMLTAMSSIQDMIDVNTIIGEPIEANGIIIIPISKVGFGFAAGGSEFACESMEKYSNKSQEEEIEYRLPFGGGSGAGISINPVGFIIVGQGEPAIKFISVDHKCSIDKVLDYMPDVIEKAGNLIEKMCSNKKDDEKTSKNDTAKQENKKNEKEKITYEFKYGDKKAKDNKQKTTIDEDE